MLMEFLKNSWLALLLTAAAAYLPVSYTHLDVYKRQATFCLKPSYFWKKPRRS